MSTLKEYRYFFLFLIVSLVGTMLLVRESNKTVSYLDSLNEDPKGSGQVLGQSFLSPHINVGAVIYPGTAPGTALTDWMANRFNMMVTPSKDLTYDPRTYNPNTVMLEYKDWAGIYADEETYKIRDFAAARGYTEEDFFLHMNVDYTNTAWQEMGWFDKAERNFSISGTPVEKGVFVYNGSSYADKTQSAFNSTVADVSINNTLYFGYAFPFDRAYFTLSTARVGGSVTWQYWNGSSWANVTPKQDDTTGLSKVGTGMAVVWTPPSDWLRTSVNGSKEKWWVRAVVSGATTYPVASRIYGDNWLTGTKSRGWAASNPGRIVCCGGWEYDPNPPAGSTARFKYQARVHSFFGTRDAYLVNHSKLAHDGKNPWAQYMAVEMNKTLAASGWNGVMVDNLDSISELITSPADWRDHMDWTWPYRDSETASFKEFRATLRSLRPGAIVGGNAGAFYQPAALAGDMVLLEAFDWVRGIVGYDTSLTRATFDDFLSQNNPNGTKGLFMIMDNLAGVNSLDGGGAGMDGVDTAGNYFAYDKSDRRPIAGLSYYYIGSNPNTYFVYNAFGFQYGNTDQVRYYTDNVTSVTSPIARAATHDSDSAPLNPAKNITVADASKISVGQIIQIGTAAQLAAHTGEHVIVDYVNGNVLNTKDAIYNSYPGDGSVLVNTVSLARQATDVVDYNKIAYYANWFPAIGVDIGQPDPSGHKGGARDTAFVTGASIGDGGENIYRRDFTKAMVLFRPAQYTTTASQYNTPQPSSPIQLGGTYYPLKANGTTGPGITSVQLRSGEGKILMKQPVGSPSNPTGDAVAPGISSVSSSGITGSSAIVTWTTSEPADSQVEYGPSTSYGSSSSLNGTQQTSHSVSLSGLSAATTYHFRVKSRDAAGNLATSGNFTFTTAAAGTAPANVARGIVPTSSVPFDATQGPASSATDGVTGSGFYARLDAGSQWIQLDLGRSYSLSSVKLWHYYNDSRRYRDVIIQLSNDPSFSTGVTTVFNNDSDNSAGRGAGTDAEYAETSSGKTISFNAITARYVRHWLNGSSANTSNHFVEMEVYGTSGSSSAPIPGDLNNDRIVNSLDYSLMNGKWNQSYAAYDLNGDSFINSLDFAILKSNWGRTD